jgi:putative nucleotidyltransferase with HDIG domain
MTTDLGLQNAQRLATLLSGGMHGGYYPAGHPAALQPFKEMAALVASLQTEGGELVLAVVDGVLSVGGHFFFAPTAPLQEVVRSFEQKRLLGVTLKAGVTPGELLALARLVGETAGGVAAIKEGLRSAGVTKIEVREVNSLPQTYQEAVGVIRDIFHEIGTGRIPNSRDMLTVVSSLASVAVKEPATLMGLTLIKDYDNYTFQHSVNVGILAMALAASMGESQQEVEEAGMAGFLHDVGKTRIHKGIINKPGKLSSEEYVEMKRHPEFGAGIVRQMRGVPERVAEAVLGHHIRHDRGGYPEWATSRPFSVTSGIVAVADCYDATTTLRAYQRPMQPKEAVDRIRNLSGTSLDGEIVQRFLELTGNFPTGSLVRLDSNEIAVVTVPSVGESGAAVVKVIIEATGEVLAEPELRDLPGSGGRIIDVVDPMTKRIDVARYL